mmetsp:Transcript_17293/g.24426  ORF Transcript_17293/g.24426 Transcript_17293/m.24426 type:complete len:200 (+) Transcript_17293:26-625(+)
MTMNTNPNSTALSNENRIQSSTSVSSGNNNNDTTNISNRRRETTTSTTTIDEMQEDSQSSSLQFSRSLNATCNRLSKEYLNLLRAASSSSALDTNPGGTDPRAGGGSMKDPNVPPAPLAADAALTSLQAKLAAQNLCVASSDLLDLIRTLRLSALLMERSSIALEEEKDCKKSRQAAEMAMKKSKELEWKLLQLRNNDL